LAVLLLWAGMQASVQLSAMEIIAHRGASADAPENTMPAFKLAWEQKADSIELDLWLSKDGKLVVFHDADTKRFESSPRQVSTLTWSELQQIDVGAWKGPEFKGTRIPTLDSVLATIPFSRRAVLELKSGPEIVRELCRAVADARRTPEELAIISFHFDALIESKKMLPQIPHYFLHSYQKDPATGRSPEIGALIQRCRKAGFDGLDLHQDWPIDKAFVETVRAAGLHLIVWTVDDPVVAKRLTDARVDGITTNRPKFLREQLN
jgi:glycerophosphoryl diester phosphodiesterase